MCPTRVKQSSITWHLLLLLPGLSQGAGTEAQAGTGTDLPAALCSHAETWRSCCFMLSPASAHRSSDVEYRKTFSKTLTCPCFFEKGRKETEWSLEASKGRKAGDSVRTWGHAVHCEAEVLFPPPICQTERYKELQNQEMSDKYRKALKPFVIKQN